MYFTVGNKTNEFIVNFHTSEKSDPSFVLFDTESHYPPAEGDNGDWLRKYRFSVQANSFKVSILLHRRVMLIFTIDEHNRWAWAIRKLGWFTEPTTKYNILHRYWFVFYITVLSCINFWPAYTKGNRNVSSAEYKIRTLPANGPVNFISGGDMSMDASCHKVF